MATFTYNKLIEANSVAKTFFLRNTKETPFSKTLERFFELARPFIENKGGYNERANKINRETAAKDPKRHGTIALDANGVYLYTAAGLQRRDDLMNELGEETIEFEPEFCADKDVPVLSLSDQLILKGIVIHPDYSSAEKPQQKESNYSLAENHIPMTVIE